MSKATIVELDASNTCKICDNALSKYSCPKCDITYCSVSCYQSEKHAQCSEEFYKKCIVEELKLENTDDSRKKMEEILARQNLGVEEEELDSDDDDDLGDITERLKGVDLDNADHVWEKLTGDEQKEFIAFLKSEDVTKLVPSWEPWWNFTSKNVEEVDKANNYKKACPALVKIRDFSDLSKKAPSECVQFNLVNILGAYAFATRYFNGEHEDFTKEVATCIATISLTLRVNHNFEDHETAVKSLQFECTESDWIVADKENFNFLREDLAKILQGPNSGDSKFYILSALSDLHRLFTSALKTSHKSTFNKIFPNDHFPQVKLESKNKIKAHVKKIEFMLAYAKDCYTG